MKLPLFWILQVLPQSPFSFVSPLQKPSRAHAHCYNRILQLPVYQLCQIWNCVCRRLWGWHLRSAFERNEYIYSICFELCSAYEDLTCSVHTVNNTHLFSYQWHVYLCNWGPYVRLAFGQNMSSPWNKVIIIIIMLSDNNGHFVV